MSEHVNPGYVSIGVFKQSAEHQPADDRLALPAWPPCHGGLTGHMHPAAGLRFSVAATPGSGIGKLTVSQVSTVRRAWGDRQISGEEKDCTAISQRLLP